jgi:hypothetical protein
VTDRERAEALEQENAELRAKLTALETRPRGPDARRRARVASMLFAGGVLAGLSGLFAHSVFLIACGLGWILGGAAVGSTVSSTDE